MNACAKKPSPDPPQKIPKVADLNLDAAPRWVPPEPTLLERLGQPTQVMGFDVETHDWLQDSPHLWYIGPFGFTTTLAREQFEYQRVVQLGWVVGGAAEHTHTIKKSWYVQPVDFEISAKAKTCHGITQALALREGKPLADVLREFMNDALELVENGGRLVAHQVEFDAGVIYQELGRCGLEALQDRWMRIMRKGFCTMDPLFGRWLKICTGEQVGQAYVKHLLRLDRAFLKLFPKEQDIHKKHHDAGFDAQMTRMVYVEALNRARTLTQGGRQTRT